MNSMWPSELLNRRFSPPVVSEMTGVDGSLQRLWAHRYDDFRSSAAQDGRRRRWLWAGVLGLSVFSDVFSDLGDAKMASKVAVGASDAAFERDQFGLYEFDLRAPDDGDLILAVPFGDALWSGPATAGRFASYFSYGNADLRPKRAYVYNFSDMQRRMFDRLSAFDGAN